MPRVRGKPRDSYPKESYELSRKSADLNKELQDSMTVQPCEEINKGIPGYRASRARNSYVQSIAGSSDYVVNMQKEIASVQGTY